MIRVERKAKFASLLSHVFALHHTSWKEMVCLTVNLILESKKFHPLQPFTVSAHN